MLEGSVQHLKKQIKVQTNSIFQKKIQYLPWDNCVKPPCFRHEMDLTEKVFLQHVWKVVKAWIDEDRRDNETTYDYKQQGYEEALKKIVVNLVLQIQYSIFVSPPCFFSACGNSKFVTLVNTVNNNMSFCDWLLNWQMWNIESWKGLSFLK